MQFYLENVNVILRQFLIKKLQTKHQSSTQQKQTSYAITLYYSLLRLDSKNSFPDLNHSLPDEDKYLRKQAGSLLDYEVLILFFKKTSWVTS